MADDAPKDSLDARLSRRFGDPAPSSEPRAHGRPFTPGVSGNPGGRPKGYSSKLKEIVEDTTVMHPTLGTISAWDAVVHKAIEDALSDNPSARRYAREWLADRLMGKPKQHVEVTEPPAATINFEELDDKDLDALIARLERETSPGGSRG
jgi:hypothetical protein